ncbi:MAG: hypothetical protein IPK58_08175 [Acidobacteria bacterium]|nr:hypothetical protein [Acidobacteriota bacterium]
MFIDGDSELKSGRALVVTGSNTTVAKFDRDSPDDLDTWSKLRAREISSVNARLERDSMRNSLLNSYNNGRWNAFNSFGLWVFDPFRRMWSFLPFGSGWGSPYGYDYRFDMWNYCNMPYWVYTNPNGNGNGTGTGGGGSTGGGGTTTVPNANRERTDNLRTPPFQRTNQAGSRVERNESDSPVFNGSGDGMNTNNQRRRVESDDSPNNDSKPVRTPPPPPPTPIIVIQNPNSKSKDN